MKRIIKLRRDYFVLSIFSAHSLTLTLHTLYCNFFVQTLISKCLTCVLASHMSKIDRACSTHRSSHFTVTAILPATHCIYLSVTRGSLVESCGPYCGASTLISLLLHLESTFHEIGQPLTKFKQPLYNNNSM